MLLSHPMRTSEFHCIENFSKVFLCHKVGSHVTRLIDIIKQAWSKVSCYSNCIFQKAITGAVIEAPAVYGVNKKLGITFNYDLWVASKLCPLGLLLWDSELQWWMGLSRPVDSSLLHAWWRYRRWKPLPYWWSVCRLCERWVLLRPGTQ